MMRALYSGDFATVIDSTHPLIVGQLGDRERAIETMKLAMTPVLKKGASIESLRFPRPPEFVETPDATFAIVPTLMVLNLQGRRFESLNYQFGVLEGDRTKWRYAEGARIKTETVRSMFPGFPENHRFPEIYRKRL